MRNREKKSNIVKFPNVEKLLVEKGLNCLERKQFLDAIRFFEEAKEEDPYNEQLLIGLLIAYFEANYLCEAKEVANEILQKGIGDYYQVMDLYIMILLQLHEYEEVIETIQLLLEEQHFSIERQEHLKDILIFSKKMLAGKQESLKPDTNKESKPALPLQAITNEQEQLTRIKNFADQNVRPYMDEITEFLKAEASHPLLKTMLLHILKEQEIEKELIVTKFGMTKQIRPRLLDDMPVQLQVDITTVLQEMIASEDPVLYENIKALVEQQFFLLYPFELTLCDVHICAAAYHLLGLQYHGYEILNVLDKIVSLYHVPQDKLEEKFARIQEIDRHTYPII